MTNRPDIAEAIRSKALTLLDAAQMVWFSRFLEARSDASGSIVVPMEIWTWARARTSWDGYPNLGTVTWPM